MPTENKKHFIIFIPNGIGETIINGQLKTMIPNLLDNLDSDICTKVCEIHHYEQNQKIIDGVIISCKEMCTKEMLTNELRNKIKDLDTSQHLFYVQGQYILIEELNNKSDLFSII